ncbi:hypothetical protein BDN72DRAFT_960022 [Pluteus cervinus]|uniref:Uncharacterized protein n=1 Tax=Pluteus cervinus TaxID=181527 RepID=A0ACD3AS71_9AGAR|nr:hypothetical protein BDN72DRAFT_960022 [Pluteus cervinus]
MQVTIHLNPADGSSPRCYTYHVESVAQIAGNSWVDPAVNDLQEAVRDLKTALQKVKKDKLSLHELASDLYQLVDFIQKHAEAPENYFTRGQVILLTKIIQDLHKLAEKYGSRMWLSRYLHRQDDLKARVSSEEWLNILCRMDPTPQHLILECV